MEPPGQGETTLRKVGCCQLEMQQVQVLHMPWPTQPGGDGTPHLL